MIVLNFICLIGFGYVSISMERAFWPIRDLVPWRVWVLHNVLQLLQVTMFFLQASEIYKWWVGRN